MICPAHPFLLIMYNTRSKGLNFSKNEPVNMFSHSSNVMAFNVALKNTY